MRRRPAREPRALFTPVPWGAWVVSALGTLALCAFAGFVAYLVSRRIELFYFAMGLGVVLEVAALMAMVLDSFRVPGGLIVGTVVFLPWSLVALAYMAVFRRDVLRRWFPPKLHDPGP